MFHVEHCYFFVNVRNIEYINCFFEFYLLEYDLCNRYIVTWSGQECSSHINLYLCALFFWSDFMSFDDSIIDVLYGLAEQASLEGEIPVGCLVFDGLGNIVGKGYNNRQGSCNVLGHAEINGILEAERSLGDWRLDGCVMLVSLEPCDLCSLVIEKCRLSKIFFVLPSKSGDFSSKFFINKEMLHVSDEVYSKFEMLLTDFFCNMRQ